jgi:hypothetical protein
MHAVFDQLDFRRLVGVEVRRLLWFELRKLSHIWVSVDYMFKMVRNGEPALPAPACRGREVERGPAVHLYPHSDPSNKPAGIENTFGIEAALDLPHQCKAIR